MGAKFLRIIKRIFPNNNPLNKNTVKVSYRCLPNLKNHIENHNSQILNNNNNQAVTARLAGEEPALSQADVQLRMLYIELL